MKTMDRNTKTNIVILCFMFALVLALCAFPAYASTNIDGAFSKGTDTVRGMLEWIANDIGKLIITLSLLIGAITICWTKNFGIVAWVCLAALLFGSAWEIVNGLVGEDQSFSSMLHIKEMAIAMTNQVTARIC
ncbi:MAG: TrbC/VirB2 family protein [Proteobacteria bacterium]|nr:TrbC/VirB2 family protein [Pseudomonadota bacterium]